MAQSSARTHSRGARAVAGAAWGLYGYAALMAFGLALYAADSPAVDPHPARAAAPLASSMATGPTNLAHVSSGGRVTASSYYAFAHHHPLFVIDGREAPTPLEKWSSHPDDRAPWLEVAFAERADVGAVRLVLAGAHESPAATMRDVTIRCLRDGAAFFERSLTDNVDPRPEVAVACLGADAVRVEFGVSPAGEQPLDVARVYELEVLTPDD